VLGVWPGVSGGSPLVFSASLPGVSGALSEGACSLMSCYERPPWTRSSSTCSRIACSIWARPCSIVAAIRAAPVPSDGVAFSAAITFAACSARVFASSIIQSGSFGFGQDYAGKAVSRRGNHVLDYGSPAVEDVEHVARVWRPVKLDERGRDGVFAGHDDEPKRGHRARCTRERLSGITRGVGG
jgi:hypothetical protein